MMKNFLIAVTLIFVLSSCAQADVRHESVVEYKFSGSLGTVMKVFGMGKPIHTIDYYKGNIKRSDVLDKKGKVESSEIIDLDKKLFISINHKKKRYTQMTFDEWRQNMSEAMQEVEKMETDREKDQDNGGREYSYKFDLQTGDQPEEVHGFKANKMTMTVEVYSREKGSDEEPVKEMAITSDNWTTPDLTGNDEIDAFNKKLMAKLDMNPEDAEMASMFEQLSQSNPELAEAMEKMKEEDKKIEGVPIKSVTVFETIKADDEEEPEEEESGGGMFGGLKKKAAGGFMGGDDNGPGKLLELHSDIIEHSIDLLNDELFTIPEKYKLKD